MKNKVCKIFIVIMQLITSLSSAQQKSHIFVGPNILVSKDGVNHERLAIAVNPLNPKNILIAGTLLYNNPPGGAENRCYVSNDGGYNWIMAIPQKQTSNYRPSPQVAFNKSGLSFLSLLSDSLEPATIKVYRSEDNGLSWGRPINLSGKNYNFDKLTIDKTNSPYAGRVYISTLKLENPYRICLFSSEDDGNTWNEPVELFNGGETLGTNVPCPPLVFSDGSLFVPIVKWSNSKELEPYRQIFLFAVSKDGGKTFSSPQPLLSQNSELGNSVKGFPEFAIDNESDGKYKDRIYVVWQQNIPSSTNAQLLLSYSSNRGKSWSVPKVISNSETENVDGRQLPAVAVNKRGVLLITWNSEIVDSKENKHLCKRMATASLDGGETFLTSVPVSNKETNLSSISERAVSVYAKNTTVGLSGGLITDGVYQGLTASPDGIFHHIWSDGRTGTFQIWTAQIKVEEEQQMNNAELTNTDVSKYIKVVLDPLREFTSDSILEVPVRLKNISKETIYGPLIVEVSEMYLDRAYEMKDGKPIKKDGQYVVVYIPSDNKLLNADNGKPGVGATFDFTKSLGSFQSLASGAVSGEVIFRFKKPTNEKEFPDLTLKVMGKIKEGKNLNHD